MLFHSERGFIFLLLRALFYCFRRVASTSLTEVEEEHLYLGPPLVDDELRCILPWQSVAKYVLSAHGPCSITLRSICGP